MDKVYEVGHVICLYLENAWLRLRLWMKERRLIIRDRLNIN
jgi:hypothetical protein